MVGLRRCQLVSLIALAASITGCSRGSPAAEPAAGRLSPDRAYRPVHADWRLIADSDLILKATLRVPVDEITTARANGSDRYVTLVAQIEEVLEGEASSATVPVRYFTRHDWWHPAPDDVVRAHGRQVILFLVDVEDAYYFAGGTPGSLLTYADSIAGPLRAEISQQQAILARSRAELDDGTRGRVAWSLLSAETSRRLSWPRSRTRPGRFVIDPLARYYDVRVHLIG